MYLPEVSVSSTMAPRERRYCHDVQLCLRIEHRYRRIKWQVFHDVSLCFKSVS